MLLPGYLLKLVVAVGNLVCHSYCLGDVVANVVAANYLIHTGVQKHFLNLGIYAREHHVDW